MLTKEPELIGFELPTAQEVRDEKIRRLLEVLHAQYGGDMNQLFASKTKAAKARVSRPEIPWATILSTLQKRRSSGP